MGIILVMTEISDIIGIKNTMLKPQYTFFAMSICSQGEAIFSQKAVISPKEALEYVKRKD
ncbi:MAG: hypothetical protein FWB77_03645 [Treponema sp.]|nr:hypothetical protein [Treponema sp.]